MCAQRPIYACVPVLLLNVLAAVVRADATGAAAPIGVTVPGINAGGLEGAAAGWLAFLCRGSTLICCCCCCCCAPAAAGREASVQVVQ